MMSGNEFPAATNTIAKGLLPPLAGIKSGLLAPPPKTGTSTARTHTNTINKNNNNICGSKLVIFC